ncbi:site-specific integrase [Robertmurraya sp.]|uniref:site-specific integrase n=1 Tax=Robertmurraya sp. TaxID=2837525 RepID=UPI003703CCD5
MQISLLATSSEIIERYNGLSQPISETTKEYLKHAKAENTIKSYRTDWKHFKDWCIDNDRTFLPATPETVSDYLSSMAAANYKPSTIQRRISAISQAHQAANYESPTHSPLVRTLWASILRVHGTQQQGKAPATIDDIRLMIEVLPSNNIGIRDRAILLIGFAGGFRRSEIVALNKEDIEFTREGLVIHQRKSKVDQEGEGRKVGIPYGGNLDTCPVRSLQDWLEAGNIGMGPIFRPINRHLQVRDRRLSDQSVALIIKRYAELAGLDVRKYSGHSLRAGLVTSAHLAGKSERAIMKQTGHRSVTTVRKYIREASVFQDNAATGIGL